MKKKLFQLRPKTDSFREKKAHSPKNSTFCRKPCLLILKDRKVLTSILKKGRKYGR